MIMPIGGDMGLYIAIMVLTLIVGGGAQLYVTSQLKKYSRVQSTLGLTGAETAMRMGSAKGLVHVGVNRGGPNQDFFDPRTNAVTLGTEAYGQRTITAVATAAHEMGHAEQFAQGYAFMKFRSALVPVVNFCSNAWVVIFMFGLFAGAMGPTLMKVAIVMFAAVLLFQLVTLPVEFDASRRGLAYLRSTGMGEAELSGAYSVLRACALTYVAAALTALLQLVYLVLSTRSEE